MIALFSWDDGPALVRTINGLFKNSCAPFPITYEDDKRQCPGTTGRWEGLFQVPCYLIQRGTNGYFARVHTWTILPSITTWEWSLENGP
ncbi:hypothetical protein B0F90DRAFT_1736717 [Multifurca ochricompacta]|uniref:Uncharacterized protein n=1 Tax=Multifurca ochricompacta TaxID=376703 RepID=A0AAD4M2I1_9AGAM|nr:hypothetical protein B0F90DRAFT_1736717 [Multifurca ochricompacta]